ncbi:MAG: hypothetical protein NTX03_03145 [Bacteroidetes bacterium]|nr:hypothetical protein [Bacteroidota bacterium]
MFKTIFKQDSQLGKVFFYCCVISLVLHLVCAYFSLGFYHPDEHFQILEFASFRLGNLDPNYLPWEYPARMRPALQPAMVCSLVKYFGVTNSFTITFLLRLFSGIFSWGVFWFFIFQCSKMLETAKAKKYLFLLSTFLFFVTFIHVRFSSENMAGTFCFFGLGILLFLFNHPSESAKKIAMMLLTGFLFGLSYVFRMQIAIVPLSIVLWALWAKKINVYNLSFIVVGGVLAVAIGILADKWFYGEWTNTVFNYFKMNFLENKAAQWGVMPKYWYLQTIIIKPYSHDLLSAICRTLVVVSFFYLWVSSPKHIFTWVSLPFFLLHSFIGHKEVRFLFPLINLVPFVFVFMMEKISNRDEVLIQKIPKWLKKYSVGFSLIVVVIVNASFIFSPADKNIPYYKFVDDTYKEKPVYFIGYKSILYNVDGLTADFYIPKNVLRATANSVEDIKYYIAKKDRIVVLFTPQKGFIPPAFLDSVGTDYSLKYCSLPMFIKGNNLNHWQKRTSTTGIYEFK